MAEAFIVGAVRTPVGRRNGGLAAVHPVDLAAHVLTELVARTGADPAAVDDVIMGCVSQMGPQSIDIARNAWLSAGLPDNVPGVTIDRQCGSSQQAVHFAAQAVLSGTQDLVVAAGVESMSMVPMGSTVALPYANGMPLPFGQGWKDRYGDQEISQFRGAQLVCEKWGIKRQALEEFSLESHQRAIRAIDEGRFALQITPVGRPDHRRGAAPRHVAGEDGRPGAAAGRLGNHRRDGLPDLRWRRRADDRVAGRGQPLRAHAAGAHPHADRDRVRPGLHAHRAHPGDRAGARPGRLDIGDIDVFEVNEAFAPVLIAWAADTGASLEKTNPNGGAIALGHPLGATGAILMTKLLHELERTGGRYGLQTMCEGGGQANATIIERLS